MEDNGVSVFNAFQTNNKTILMVDNDAFASGHMPVITSINDSK